MGDWIDDALSGFLKVNPGWHELTILGDPEEVESKYGKKQWSFNAILDGAEGVLIPPKRLLRIIAAARKNAGKWPVKITVERIGEGMQTTWKLAAAPGINDPEKAKAYE